jgi:HK97 gp10 family phage protein
MSVKISVTGIAEIDKVLRGMPAQLSHTVLGQAHAAAAKPLVERAKLLAPEGPTGNLVDSIGAEKESFSKVTQLGQVQAGPRRSRRHKGHVAHLVEYGTTVRANRKGANRGAMRKSPFMQRAFDQTKNLVEGSIAEQIGKKLSAYMRKTLGRALG